MFIVIVLTSGGGGKKSGKKRDPDFTICEVKQEKTIKIVFQWFYGQFNRISLCPSSISSQFPLNTSNILLATGAEYPYLTPGLFHCVVRVRAYCKNTYDLTTYDKTYKLWKQGETNIVVPADTKFTISVNYFEECSNCYSALFTSATTKLRTLYTYDSVFAAQEVQNDELKINMVVTGFGGGNMINLPSNGGCN